MSLEENTPEQSKAAEQPDPLIEARGLLGKRLVQAREARELGLNEASEQLRIRKAYLQGLESGDWKALPEEVYAMGFLRQYAALLGVDISQDMEALKSGEYRLTKPFTMPDPPISMNRTWALAAGICFLLLLILFNVVGDGEKEMSPPPPPALENTPADTTLMPPLLTEQADTRPSTPDTGTDTVGATDRVETATDSHPGEAMPARHMKHSTAAPDKTTPVEKKTTPTPAQQAPEPTVDTAVSFTQASSGRVTGHSYHLTAVDADVWLQLHHADGSLAKEALLRAGQTLRLNIKDDILLLTSGKPRALLISIDGQSIARAGTLGEAGKVLRDYRLQLPSSVPAGSNP
ncbi:MAG: DUF4115 domain-containing protein [Mariprofundaceae bacterium]|nr:DUF4115 domain-containing protein [Mariprofundaceae bacterium]